MEKFDYYEVIAESIECYSWCPTPEPTVPPTQVHLLIPLAGGKVCIRFKGTHTIDQLIEQLKFHRTDVFGEATDADIAAAKEKLRSTTEHLPPPPVPPGPKKVEVSFDLEGRNPFDFSEHEVEELTAAILRGLIQRGDLDDSPAARIRFISELAQAAPDKPMPDRIVLMRIISTLLHFEHRQLEGVLEVVETGEAQTSEKN